MRNLEISLRTARRNTLKYILKVMGKGGGEESKSIEFFFFPFENKWEFQQ